MKTDLAAGALLTALGLVVAVQPDSVGNSAIAMLTIPIVTLPVIVRRAAPFAATGAVCAGIVVSALPTFHQVRCGVAFPAIMLVLYSLGSRGDRRSALRGLSLALCAVVFLAFTDPNLGPGALVIFLPLCAGVWAVGGLVASRARTAVALAQRSAQLERQREETARLAVEVERSRLTSDLGSGVHEQLGAIVRLAAEGEHELAADPAASRRAFARIESSGRASLDEMRGLLGALRSDEHAVRAPRPTLAQLDALLVAARVSGRVVDLDIAGEPRVLAEGVELAAFRIIEHALAAIVGDDEPVRVSLRFGLETLDVEVEAADHDGSAVVEAPIVAARAQVAARGGSFDLRAAGPGRRSLCARLPLAAEQA